MNKLVVKHKVKGEDVPTTTSRKVAEIFEKEHKNVIQSIENLIAENSAVKNMFMLSTYKVRGRDFKEYLLTFDGFALSVSGVQKVKDRYLAELEEGKHWVLGQNVSKLGGQINGISKSRNIR